jgi:cell division protein FtsB
MHPPTRAGAAHAARAWQRLRAWLSGLPTGDTTAPGHLPRFFVLFLLLFALGMVLISLVGDQGLIAYYGLQREAAHLRREVGVLEQRRVTLIQQIEALRSDPEYIAHLARQRLGLIKAGETVLQLPRAERRP